MSIELKVKVTVEEIEKNHGGDIKRYVIHVGKQSGFTPTIYKAVYNGDIIQIEIYGGKYEQTSH